MKNNLNLKNVNNKHVIAFGIMVGLIAGALFLALLGKPVIAILTVVSAYTILAITRFMLDLVYITGYREQYMEEVQRDEQPAQSANSSGIGESPLQA